MSLLERLLEELLPVCYLCGERGDIEHPDGWLCRECDEWDEKMREDRR